MKLFQVSPLAQGELSPEVIQGLVGELPDWLRNNDSARYLSNNYLVIDFETTILDKGSPYNEENKVVCSGFRGGPGHPSHGGRTTFVLGNQYDQSELVAAIEAADFWVAHNSKFEYGWLERCGLPLEKHLAFCTMLSEYVLLSNRSRPDLLSLNKCLQRRGMPMKDDLGSKLLKAEICPSQWPLAWLKRYQVADVELTERLFLHQRRALVHFGRLTTLFTRCILTAPLVDMEKNGMHLDKERVEVLYRDYSARQRKLSIEIDEFIGGANVKSPKQMRKVLYEDLKFAIPRDTMWLGKPDKEGNPTPTTSWNYISTLTPKNKKQKEFQRLQKELSNVNSALSKSLEKFHLCCDETPDHILTASLNQAITVTQRLSSTGKNYRAQLQNIARIFKPLFSARFPDWDIGEIDQAQLEYRVAVFLGQDVNGLADILNKVDAHAFTAEHVFGSRFIDAPIGSAVRDALRTDAKSRTFKPLYGGQSGTKDEVRYYKAFCKKHYGIIGKQNEWKRSALNTGKVTIPSGLTFYFPGTRMLDDGYITNSTNICNYPVQSLATADIVPIGVTFQWHLMRVAQMVSFLINTIHDSAIGEVHPEEKALFAAIGEYAHVDLVYTYLKDVYGIDFNVPLEAEVKYGSNWADSADWQKKYLTNMA